MSNALPLTVDAVAMVLLRRIAATTDTLSDDERLRVLHIDDMLDEVERNMDQSIEWHHSGDGDPRLPDDCMLEMVQRTDRYVLTGHLETIPGVGVEDGNVLIGSGVLPSALTTRVASGEMEGQPLSKVLDVPGELGSALIQTVAASGGVTVIITDDLPATEWAEVRREFSADPSPGGLDAASE